MRSVPSYKQKVGQIGHQDPQQSINHEDSVTDLLPTAKQGAAQQ